MTFTDIVAGSECGEQYHGRRWTPLSRQWIDLSKITLFSLDFYLRGFDRSEKPCDTKWVLSLLETCKIYTLKLDKNIGKAVGLRSFWCLVLVFLWVCGGFLRVFFCLFFFFMEDCEQCKLLWHIKAWSLSVLILFSTELSCNNFIYTHMLLLSFACMFCTKKIPLFHVTLRSQSSG